MGGRDPFDGARAAWQRHLESWSHGEARDFAAGGAIKYKGTVTLTVFSAVIQCDSVRSTTVRRLGSERAYDSTGICSRPPD